MKTSRRIVNTLAAGVAAALALAGPLHAQTGAAQGRTRPMNTVSPHGGLRNGRTGMLGMLGPIKVTGIATMNGKAYTMQGTMTPTDSRMAAAVGRPLTASRSALPGRPLEMAGTMTMMGQTYYCTVTMTPPGNVVMPGK